MKKYLLPKEGKFYKANLHMHTTISDGQLTLEETKRLYKEQGYSIVAFTDHEVMVPHNDLTDENFLAITSTEISFNISYEREFIFNKCYHLNFYSRDPNKNVYSTFCKKRVWLTNSQEYITEEQNKIDFPRVYSINDVNNLISMAKKDGCIVSYNHPVWSLQNYSDYSELKGIWGIEWWNSGCVCEGYIDSIQPIDDLLRKGENVFPLATDDAHELKHCFGGWVNLKATKLDYETVFNALEKGDFYSSNGPEIKELFIEDGIVTIKTSNASKIFMSTERRYNKCFNGSNLIEAKFDINEYILKSQKEITNNHYIRFTVVDEKGKIAYTRGYRINELI
ncbi:MAG: PHP domain-containing protein [Erysipelotrichaceae bacterium]|nr:PHP domain-containing protein [Erysipelotrichaceae bacterium]